MAQELEQEVRNQKSEYLSVEAFAKLLSISECTVRRMIAAEEIPAYRIRPGGRKFVIDVQQALGAMKTRKAC
ncbi:MAG: excisionase family DNA-binding protein [Spirochaetes bacterium]|nr:excisionase family DNA-binding protein [Spirochaetota bacterium]